MVYFPVDDVPMTTSLPGDVYELIVKEVKSEKSKGGDGKPAKKMFVPEFEVGSGDYTGRRAFVGNYIIGSDKDPDGLDPQTYVKNPPMGVQHFAALCKALQLGGGDDADIRARMAGRRFWGIVNESMDKSEDPRYRGQMRNNIPLNGYHAIGRKPERVAGQTTGGSTPAPLTSMQIPGVAAPMVPVVGGANGEEPAVWRGSAPQPQRRMMFGGVPDPVAEYQAAQDGGELPDAQDIAEMDAQESAELEGEGDVTKDGVPY